MQYLEYQEYINLGGTLDATAFNRYIVRACGMIDNATYSRVAKMKEIPIQVKALCRDLVEYMQSNMHNKGVVTSKSQSAGGVSESEIYEVKTKEEQAADIDGMIYDYLMSVNDDNGTPLLYRGCSA